MIQASSVSIVVPAYNVREYIDECIGSILANGGAEATIILVDDGSTDGTGEVLREHQRRHDNIILVHTPNRGQSAARNLGLDLCRTPFVSFVDSDDMIATAGLARLCAAADPDVDTVFSNRAKLFDATGKQRINDNFDSKHRVGMADLKKPQNIMAPHGKLFRTEFLKERGIRFPEGMVWEDTCFTYEASLHAGLVSSIPDVTYLWRIRSGENRSTTQKLLTPFSLESRMRQIRFTEPMHHLDDWKARFGPSWYKREFGMRLMLHLDAIKASQDEAVARAAFESIRAFAEPYRESIERSLRGWKRQVYRDLFAGRIEAFLGGVRAAGSGEAQTGSGEAV